MTTCSDIMTPNPRCHEQTATIDLIAKTMKENGIGPVPIVDSRDGMHLVGILTDRDIVVKVIADDRDIRSTKAADVMTLNPYFCQPAQDISEAIQLMEYWQVRRIPVVDREKRLVGIIAQADIATKLDNDSETAHVVQEISKG